MHRRQGNYQVKYGCAILAAMFFLWALPLPTFAMLDAEGTEGQEGEAGEDEGLVSAAHAVLMDARTGQVLFGKDMLERAEPASITKILTGLLVAENGSVEDELTASETAVRIPPGSTAMWLQEGEQLTVDEAMYGMMLRSANDAANLLAEYVAGTQAQFAKRMNDRARGLGAKGTNFTNASGLPGRNHYTTAYDMALITREAMQNEIFLRYFGAQTYLMEATDLADVRLFTNGQSMLLEDSQFYNAAVVGGKVGYTDEARHTMVTVAQRGGRTLIAVVMGCGRAEKFTDTQALLDYGFDGLHEVVVVGGQPAVRTSPLIEKGETAGEVAWLLGEQQWTLLLPAGMTAGDVRVDYEIPAQWEDGQETAKVVVRPVQQGEGIPAFFLEIPAASQIERLEDQQAEGEGAEAQGKPFEIPQEWLQYAVIALAALLGLLVAVLMLTLAARARRAKRRQRLLALRRQSNYLRYRENATGMRR